MDELLGKAGEDPLIEDLDLGEAPASGTRITTETEVQEPDTPDAVLPEDDEPIPVTVNEDNGDALQWESSDSAAAALSHAARVKADDGVQEEKEAVWSGMKPETEADNFYVNTDTSATEEPSEEDETVTESAAVPEKAASFSRDENPELPPKRGSSAGKKILLTAAVLLAVTAASYTIYGQKYHRVFLPNTVINGVDVSGKSAVDAEKLMNAGIADYSLKVKSRENADAEIHASDVDLHYDFGDTLSKLISEQSIFSWGPRYFSRHEETLDTVAKLDEARFQAAVDALPCFQTSAFKKPVDAHISDYRSGQPFTVVKEEEGTELKTDEATGKIKEAVCTLQPEIDLDQEKLYTEPEIRADDEALVKSAAAMNQYLKTDISYAGDSGIVLNGEQLHNWISPDGKGGVKLDESKLNEFIKNLASKYDTYNKPKSLKSSWGATVTVRSGSYGWKVNQDAEKSWLREAIASGTKTQRTPEFSQKAASLNGSDFGSTYVEVNLSAQHLYFYKDGKQLISSDFVSGNEAKGTVTHQGAYAISYKQRNATLRGQGYAAPVDYWMPFNNGEGFHDAPWRNAFGGSIYQTGGSHGCVNLPPAVAKTLFENVTAGTPVLVYTLPGTEPKKPVQPQPNPTESSSATDATANPSDSSAAAAPTTAPATKATEAKKGPGETESGSPNPSISTGAPQKKPGTGSVQPAPGDGGKR